MFSFFFKKKKKSPSTSQPQSLSTSSIKTSTQPSNIKSNSPPLNVQYIPQNVQPQPNLNMCPQRYSDPIRQKLDQDNDVNFFS